MPFGNVNAIEITTAVILFPVFVLIMFVPPFNSLLGDFSIYSSFTRDCIPVICLMIIVYHIALWISAFPAYSVIFDD